MPLRLFQQSDNLHKVMASSFWRETLPNGKPVSHFSLDNSCQVEKIIGARQFTGTYVPLQKSKVLYR